MTTHRKDAPLHFMGEDFASVTALRGKYPAFASDDAVRAIFAGCDTPLAVEVFCAARLAKARAASTAAARRSQYGAMRALGPIKTDKLAAAKRGGLATGGQGEGEVSAPELILPWPDRALHPNARGHWSKRAKATKAARSGAHVLALEAGWQRLSLPEGRLHLWLDFYPPDRRKRDDDGLLASMKAARDGIADALGVDDNRFVSHPWVKDEVRKGGEVRVRITGGPEA